MEIDLDDLERKARNATPGPWHFSRDSWNVSTPDCDLDICVYQPENEQNTTGELIAACYPAVILELIRMVREK